MTSTPQDAPAAELPAPSYTDIGRSILRHIDDHDLAENLINLTITEAPTINGFLGHHATAHVRDLRPWANSGIAIHMARQQTITGPRLGETTSVHTYVDVALPDGTPLQLLEVRLDHDGIARESHARAAAEPENAR